MGVEFGETGLDFAKLKSEAITRNSEYVIYFGAYINSFVPGNKHYLLHDKVGHPLMRKDLNYTRLYCDGDTQLLKYDWFAGKIDPNAAQDTPMVYISLEGVSTELKCVQSNSR